MSAALSAAVIVPAHNRPEAVALSVRTLLEGRAQDDFEVVVVDDGSEPALAMPEAPGLRLVRTAGIERSRARNLGVLSTRADLVIFMDDDISVGPDFVGAHRKAAEEFPNVIGVGAITLPEAMGQTTFGRFRRLIEDPDLRRPRGLMAEKNFCTAANMSIRRDRFLSLGGFDPAIVSSEDQDLALRFCEHGGRLAFLPEASALHRDSNADIAAYCRRHEWGARAVAPFLRRYPEREDSRARLRFDPARRSTLGGRAALAMRRLAAQAPCVRALLGLTRVAEQAGLGDSQLFALYRVLLGLHLFRGFRRGLSEVIVTPPLPLPLSDFSR